MARISLDDAVYASRNDEDFIAFQNMRDDERRRFIAEQARVRGVSYRPKPWELLFLIGHEGRQHMDREV